MKKNIATLISICALVPAFAFASGVESASNSNCRARLSSYTDEATATEACHKGWNIDEAIKMVDEGFLSRDNFRTALQIADTVDRRDLIVAKSLVREGYHKKFEDAVSTSTKLESAEINAAKDLVSRKIVPDMNEAAGVARRNTRGDIECAKRQLYSQKSSDFYSSLADCRRGNVN